MRPPSDDHRVAVPADRSDDLGEMEEIVVRPEMPRFEISRSSSDETIFRLIWALSATFSMISPP